LVAVFIFGLTEVHQGLIEGSEGEGIKNSRKIGDREGER
jgi:hypothetical protein